MIIVNLVAVKPKTKPIAIGEATEGWRDILVLMKDNGEIIKEVKTSITGSRIKPIISKTGKWVSPKGMWELGQWDVGLINTKTREILLEHGLPYHVMLEKPQLPYKATRFKKGYEKLRRFGGIYEYSEDEIIRIMKTYAAMRITGRLGWRSFSRDEKKMAIDVRNEIRIYDLETLELIDIITYDEILKAFMKAGAPRKVLKWVMNSEYFYSAINAEKPDLIWIKTGDADYNSPIVLMDIEDRSIVSPIRHPLEILRKHDIAPYVKFIPNINNPWDDELKGVKIRLNPTPTGNALIEIMVEFEETKAPPRKDPSRARYEISRLAHEQTLVILLDTDMEPVAWIHKVDINGAEYALELFPAVSYPDYLVLSGKFQPLDPKLENQYGWMRLDWEMLRQLMYVKSRTVKDALLGEIDVEEQHLLSCLPKDFAPKIYRNELLVGGEIEVPRERRGMDHEHVFIARYNIATRKARLLHIYESKYLAGRGCPANYEWGVFV